MKTYKKDGIYWVKDTRGRGRDLSLHPDGQVWVKVSDQAAASPGKVVNGYFNTYRLLGVDDNSTKHPDKYAVDDILLRYAKFLKIRKLRVRVNKIEESRRGPLDYTKYGYVSRDKFEYFRQHRRQAQWANRNVILIKKSDLTWMDE